MLFLIYILFALIMALGAMFLVWVGHKQAQEEEVSKRLALAGVQALSFPKKDWLTVRLERAGIVLPDQQRRMIGLAVFGLLVLLALQFGLPLAVFVALVLVVVAYSMLAAMYNRRQYQIVAQLPRLLDQVVRLMRTGKTLSDSFAVATRDADEPLRSVMLKLQRNIQLGMTIPEAFTDLSEVYALKELQVLALGVSVNARFGGSLIDLLNNIITLIQQREQLVRQLRAMTGETRTSALVLSGLPLLLAAFMVFSNPDYIFKMVDDPTGQWVLIGAAGMQVAGMAVIWKMLRSV